jgi:anaerobic magnesium-protoporphyrin IX monomethyl ester cyclase
MRHKIVLYNPSAVFFTMPLALVAIGSHLDPERFEVIIVDGRLEPDPVAALLRHLPGALCVGMTVLTGAPIRDAVRVSRAVKAAHPELPVVWGGWHPSMFGAECLEEPSVDVTVQGQGEATFAEIVDRLAEGDSLEGCEGCTIRGLDGSIRPNPPRTLTNVNGFRPHDYRLIEVERYYGLKGKPQLDYITSQGCHFRCAFCADPYVYGRKWVGLEAGRVGEEIEDLWKRYRFTDVNFQDETFFTYAERVAGIAEELVRREVPVTWAATMRADQCYRLSDEVFALCRRSGLRRVLVGVESGSPEMLKRIRKDITLDQIFYAAERCRAAGVAVIFPFIVGFPGETDESVQDSLDVAKKLRAMSPDFETPFFYFKPYPGSAITLDAVKDGYRLPRSLDEWADFDFIGSSGPWVAPEKYRRIERFKFYQGLGFSRGPAWMAPVQRLARWRLQRDMYALPIEKLVSERLRPAARLS